MIRVGPSYAAVLSLALSLSSLTGGCASGQVGASGTGEGEAPKGESSSSSGPDGAEPTGEPAPSEKKEDGPDASKTPEEQTPSPEASPLEPQVLGAQCRKDEHCLSGHCADVHLESGGGVIKVLRCSECKAHQDCPMAGARCVDSGLKQAKVCSMGELGRECDDDSACAEPTVCAPLLTGENVFETTYCSECRTGEDCKDPAAPNCLTLFGGEKLFNSCEPDGVRKDGEPCFPCDTGDLECQGYCVKADVPNDDSFCIGVCGSCRDDSDCADGERCTPPEFKFKEGGGFGKHVASKCVPKGE